MKLIQLAIADDQVLFLRGLKSLISSFEEIDLIISAENGKLLLDKMQRQQPDVILLDIEMPVMDGIEATKIIRSQFPEIKILLLSSHDEEGLMQQMIDLGAVGYLLKNEEPEIIRKAIKAAVEQGFYFPEYLSRALLKDRRKNLKERSPREVDKEFGITKREMEVLKLICKEYTSAEIADELVISKRTVENHRRSLIEKTGVKNTAGLVIFAIRNGLINLDDWEQRV